MSALLRSTAVTRCSYILPIRRTAFHRQQVEGLRNYLSSIAAECAEILLLDGSPDEVFAQHHAVWSPVCRHERVDRSHGYLNDKVNGIHTGVALASGEKIVLADDDIRYTPGNLQRVAGLLDEFEVVRPQNFLCPLPWWARMESARMLINRATLRTADYPGTCAFRREAMLRVGHYDGDVLFDNEEIIRHFARQGATICYANDLFVQKQPPTFRKWLEQRPRQAYEDFPLRAKTAIFLSIAPAIVVACVLGARAAAAALLAIVLIPAGLAFAGRRRGSARRFVPLTVCFFAPLWVIERTISTYCALYWFLRYGGYPFGGKLLRKGVGRDWFAGARAIPAQVQKETPR